MDGKKIFAEAVRRMSGTLTAVCSQQNIAIHDLDLLIPHQANARIIDALRSRLHLPAERVWNEIRFRGNTSSSSIPLALSTVLRRSVLGARIGICSFGAGYTFGGALLETGCH